MGYKELLQTVQWQKKKNYILKRDNYTCSLCGNNEEMLSVHHNYYEPGKKPWEYDNECYITLCSECHQYAHKAIAKISSIIAYKILKRGIDFIDVCKLLNIETK